MNRYRFIEAQRDFYPAQLLCQLVEVPASGYYAWHQTQQLAVAQLVQLGKQRWLRYLEFINAVMVRVGSASKAPLSDDSVYVRPCAA